MTIDKVKFQNVLDQATNSWTEIQALKDTVNLADPDNAFNETFLNIFTSLSEVETWANAKLLEAEQEQVMNSFLADMKVVFEKYSAKLEVGSTEDGYGKDYGNGASSTGVKFTAMLDGVTATKEINKVVITSEDLV